LTPKQIYSATKIEEKEDGWKGEFVYHGGLLS
jgi:hypothetical protein